MSTDLLKRMNTVFSREITQRIENNKCPTCNSDIIIEDFKDELSVKEYRISGMCQKCQDEVF